jgi:hypothetical protein
MSYLSGMHSKQREGLKGIGVSDFFHGRGSDKQI